MNKDDKLQNIEGGVEEKEINSWKRTSQNFRFTNDLTFGKKVKDSNLYMFLSKYDNSANFNCIKLYLKPEDMTDTEFFSEIYDGNIVSIGNFSINSKVAELDQNNNLLLERYGANLNDILKTSESAYLGNMLISQDGKVLSSLQANSFLEPANKYGYYKKTTLAKNHERYIDNNFLRRYYNFLDPLGSQVSKDDIAEPMKHVYKENIINEVKEEVSHSDSKQKPQTLETTNYTTPDTVPNKIIHISRECEYLNDCIPLSKGDLYPDSFVVFNNNQVEYFPSAAATIIEHRKREQNGLPKLLDCEAMVIKNYYERRENIDLIVNVLGINFDKKILSEENYKDAIKTINQEYKYIDEFENHFENIDDRDYMVRKMMEKMSNKNM